MEEINTLSYLYEMNNQSLKNFTALEQDIFYAMLYFYDGKSDVIFSLWDFKKLINLDIDDDTLIKNIKGLIGKLSKTKFEIDRESGEYMKFNIFKGLKVKDGMCYSLLSDKFRKYFKMKFWDISWIKTYSPVTINLDIFFKIRNPIAKTIFRLMSKFSSSHVYYIKWDYIEDLFDLQGETKKEKVDYFEEKLSELLIYIPGLRISVYKNNKKHCYKIEWSKKYEIRGIKRGEFKPISILKDNLKYYEELYKEEINSNNAAETYNQEDDDIEEYDDDYLYNEPYFSEELDYDREYY